MKEKNILRKWDLYQVRIRRKGIEITKSFEKLADAKQYRDDILGTIKINPIILERDKQKEIPLLETMITKWYENRKRPFLEPKTRVNYDAAVYNRIIPVFGKFKADEVTADRVQAWATGLQRSGNLFNGRGLNSQTVKSYVTKFKTFFNYLVNTHVVRENPCKNIRYIKDEQKEKRPFIAAEIKRILEYIKGHDTFAMYVLYSLY